MVLHLQILFGVKRPVIGDVARYTINFKLDMILSS